MEIDKTSVELVEGPTKVELEWIGEGWSGDYDPQDKEDAPLLRFTVFVRDGSEWAEVSNASYCTRLDARSDDDTKQVFLRMIMEQVRGVASPKRICERLSWIGADDLVTQAAPFPGAA